MNRIAELQEQLDEFYTWNEERVYLYVEAILLRVVAQGVVCATGRMLHHARDRRETYRAGRNCC